MKINFTVLAIVLSSVLHAQTVALPPFMKWENNNSPGCKNVFVTKDSIVMAVKTPCVSEGIRANWRPLAGLSEGTPFIIPAGGRVDLVVTYKFMPQGGDVFGFYGSIDPANPDTEIAFTRSLELSGGVKELPPAGKFTTVAIPINFSDEMDKPVYIAPAAMKGFMDFHFNVSTNGGDTHQGSVAVIKDMHVVVK